MKTPKIAHAQCQEPLTPVLSHIDRQRRNVISAALALTWVATDGYFQTVLAASSSEFAKTSQADPKPRTKLIVAFLNSPPEMVVYSKGRHSGVLQYILEEAARRSHCEIEWREMSFGHSLDALKSQNIDIVTNVRFRTPERESYSRFSINLGTIPSVIYISLNSNESRDIKSLKDLTNHRIGYRRGVYYFKEFEALPNTNRIPFDDNDAMARGFAENKIDAMLVNNKISTESALKASGVNASRYRYASLIMDKEIMSTYMMYSLKPELSPVFNLLDAELEKMLKEGLIADIYQSFDAKPPKPTWQSSADRKE